MYPVPEDEAERLQFLSGCAPFGRPAEREFDELTRLEAELFDAPVALVTLVGEADQWVHGRTGTAMEGAPRGGSPCAHAIMGDEPLIVRDVAADPVSRTSRR